MNYLKKIRKAQGLTLQALGDAIGSSKAYMHDLERQDGPIPGLYKAYALAAILDTTVESIWPDPTEIIEETIVRRRVKT